MPNIEIKARIINDYPDINALRLKYNIIEKPTEHQIDTYYKVPNGRLKMRVINIDNKTESVLIPYIRSDILGPKKCDYTFLYPNNCEQSMNLLDTILGKLCVVDKIRKIYLIDNVRVHYDEVKGLGKFMEFEAVYSESSEEEKNRMFVNQLMIDFNIQEEHLIKCSYLNLLLDDFNDQY